MILRESSPPRMGAGRRERPWSTRIMVFRPRYQPGPAWAVATQAAAASPLWTLPGAFRPMDPPWPANGHGSCPQRTSAQVKLRPWAIHLLRTGQLRDVGAACGRCGRARKPLRLQVPVVGPAVMAANYQIFTRAFGARYSFSPGFTLNAEYHWSRLRTVCARKAAGAWTSVARRWRRAASRILLRHD